MIFDSEDQRKLLISIISQTIFSGNYDEISVIYKKITDLLDSIKKAEINNK